ncbi:unnamed protein product [Rhizoctonia solani]|uniref:Fungal-specific transcription factor domain protein n=1 Tax=Rhizoctonia solani TaxID=456999 RepID=A0A8H3E4T6_9AGAM|nr:unnamed protein product [Rhizoctonia solani]
MVTGYQDVSRSFSHQNQVTQKPFTPHLRLADEFGSDGRRTETLMSPGQAYLESIFSLARPNDPPNLRLWPLQRPVLIHELKPDEYLGDPKDTEDVQSAVMGFLWLDRNTESNTLPFILQTYATWLTRFHFEPLQVAHVVRIGVSQKYVMEEELRQMLSLLANDLQEAAQLAEYDPVGSSSFSMAEAILGRRLTNARAHVESSRILDRQHAAKAMLGTLSWIILLCKVASLSSITRFMQLAAPVFRRACPGPLSGLVNLPTLLTTGIYDLHHYSNLDILLGVVTGRPMFFRYTVNFTPKAPESLFFHVGSAGMRALHGVPDRLVMIFAQMNGLYEDFGSHVPHRIVDELEQEIQNLKPVLAPSTEPLVAIGRAAVQECWFQAALIYLYMGLCGAYSTDTRVVNARTRFMTILESVRPRRNPDSFIVFPMVVLGLATDNWSKRTMIRQRMLGLPECSRPGRLGNDFVKILDNVWSKDYLVSWKDLRQACWEVAGV